MDATWERRRIDSDSDSDSDSYAVYESTLKNWLEENTDNWSKTYKAWGANRPRHSACKLIEAVIKSVSELHAFKRTIHGSLKFEENYIVRKDIKGYFHVTLVHKVVDGDVSTKTEKEDIGDMLSIIFDKILAGVPARRYVYDLKCLRALIEDCDGSVSGWLQIINHPSLWHYGERVKFILWLHMLLENDTGHYISLKLMEMNRSLGDWRQYIPRSGPFHNFLHTDDKGIYYDYPKFRKSASEHLRFFRNFLSHFKKNYFDPINLRTCCYAPDWNEMEVEFQLSEIGTNFVVKLFEMVYADEYLREVFFP